MSGNHNSGRRPKPFALQVYEGRRRAGTGEEPQFPPGIPECPTWMPPIGRDYWAHVVAELSAVPQLLRRVDRGVLEQLCKAYDRWCTFEWFCDANGWTYDYEQHYIDMNGTPAVKKYPKARPEARLAKESGQEFGRLRGELGAVSSCEGAVGGAAGGKARESDRRGLKPDGWVVARSPARTTVVSEPIFRRSGPRAGCGE